MKGWAQPGELFVHGAGRIARRPYLLRDLDALMDLATAVASGVTLQHAHDMSPLWLSTRTTGAKQISASGR